MTVADHHARSQPTPLLVSDVDGVLTDADAVPSLDVIERVAELVRRGWSLGLVTGRSHAWLDREVLAHLRARLPVEVHQQIAVACEFGGVLGTCAAGSSVELRGPAVPPWVRAPLEALAAEPRFAPLLEWDATKACGAGVEVRHAVAQGALAHDGDAALDAYAERAAALVAGADCAVRRTTFAVDVTSRRLTKHDGTRSVLARLVAAPAMAFAIGDSDGDAEMAEELAASLDVPVAFAWVGPSEPPPLPGGVAVLRTEAHFARGALEALDMLEARVRAT